MKRSRAIVVILILVVVAALLWWLFRPLQSTPPKVADVATPSARSSATPIAPPPAQEEHRKAVAEKILDVLATPITFYGKVIDQNGNPVPAADIDYGTIDRFFADGSNYDGKADAAGHFSVSGIRGAVLTVGVRKEGYYNIHGKSNGSFAYGVGPDSTRKEPPTKENPAIFELHRMGEAEPLVHVTSRQYKVSKSGQPMELDLETGRQVAAGKGDIRFERWANDQTKNERGHFDWRFQITVPKGGIIERKDQFNFEAPQEGYQNVVQISMSASLGEKWSYTVKKSYFIKVRDGHYAQINATIYGGHNNSLVLEAFINPNTESRNLEFDPEKVVKSP